MFKSDTEFTPGHSPLAMEFTTQRKLWFIFRKDHIVLEDTKTPGQIPESPTPPSQLAKGKFFFIGKTSGMACYCAHAADNLPSGYCETNLRQAFEFLPASIYKAASRASQILEWDLTHQFCGCCATALETKDGELARYCPKCSHTSYPRINPAIIVLVNKGEKLLLGRSPHFPPGRYSFLAGFVEAGETPEEAVAREVMEEVSVKVKDIRYICSQPWPFPNSLMLGFFATYESGTIKTDEKEIEDAAWFAPDKLPYMPGKLSLARKLLDTYARANNITALLQGTYEDQKW